MILGLDVSTSITGATVLDSAGKIMYNESWDTRNKKKYPTLYHKAAFIEGEIMKIRESYDIKSVFIEQSLQSFRSGFSSAKTLSTLSRFNGIVSWVCFEKLELEPQLISASTARKEVGVVKRRGENAKEKVLEFVLDNVDDFVVEYTKFGNPKPGVFDRADSYVIASAGLKRCLKK